MVCPISGGGEDFYIRDIHALGFTREKKGTLKWIHAFVRLKMNKLEQVTRKMAKKSRYFQQEKTAL